MFYGWSVTLTTLRPANPDKSTARGVVTERLLQTEVRARPNTQQVGSHQYSIRSNLGRDPFLASSVLSNSRTLLSATEWLLSAGDRSASYRNVTDVHHNVIKR
jgi:phosphatidylserine decarboxylase